MESIKREKGGLENIALFVSKFKCTWLTYCEKKKNSTIGQNCCTTFAYFVKSSQKKNGDHPTLEANKFESWKEIIWHEKRGNNVKKKLCESSYRTGFWVAWNVLLLFFLLNFHLNRIRLKCKWCERRWELLWHESKLKMRLLSSESLCENDLYTYVVKSNRFTYTIFGLKHVFSCAPQQRRVSGELNVW